VLRFLNPTPDTVSARAVEACLRCYSTCMSAGLLPFRGVSDAWIDDELRQLLIVTAELCKVTAKYLRTGNSQAGALCAVCADLCGQCAAACDARGELTECVRDCRLCMSRSLEAAQM